MKFTLIAAIICVLVTNTEALFRCFGEDNGCCTESNPCVEGDGDCDSDAHCAGDLVCGVDNCPKKYPFANSNRKDDCCMKPPLRCKGVDNGCCTESNPCVEGDGDCDSDAHCEGSLVCGVDNCPKKSPFDNPNRKDDCCMKPPLRCKGVDNGCCTESNPCVEGDGDCDSDAQCAGSLVCGVDNCPKKSPFDNSNRKDDCCMKPAQKGKDAMMREEGQTRLTDKLKMDFEEESENEPKQQEASYVAPSFNDEYFDALVE